MDDEQRRVIREKILVCTKSIVEEEGFEGISIRKVAELAGYTPGSIYQYFENKDVLVREVIKEGYEKIIEAVLSETGHSLTIEKQIRQKFKAYTRAAMEMPDYYKAVMMNDDKAIVGMTSVLDNASNGAIIILEKAIKKGIDSNEFKEGNPKIIARIIWASNFGLTMRMITEKINDEETINAFMDEQFDLLFNGLQKKERT